jgi:hypothetical protein
MSAKTAKSEAGKIFHERIHFENAIQNTCAWRALAKMQISYEYHSRRPSDADSRVRLTGGKVTGS